MVSVKKLNASKDELIQAVGYHKLWRVEKLAGDLCWAQRLKLNDQFSQLSAYCSFMTLWENSAERTKFKFFVWHGKHFS